MNRSKLDEIINLVTQIVEPAGFECIEAEWAAAERILRLYVDRLVNPDNEAPGCESLNRESPDCARQGAEATAVEKSGIDLEGCVTASRLLVDVAELDALVPGAYTLEVSSPGIERPLRQRQHFEQHLGETVQVKLADKTLPRRNGTGRLVKVSDGEPSCGVSVTVETEQGPWTFPLQSLQKASLVYDWNNAVKH